MHEREAEKIEKYQDLKKEIGRQVGALGIVCKRLDVWLEKLSVTIRTGLLQKTALLGTARTLRKLLES